MSDISHSLVVNMTYEYYIIGKIRYKIERGGEGGQPILYEYKIANLPKLLISSLSINHFLQQSVNVIDFTPDLDIYSVGW